MMTHPGTVLGLGDGGAHCGLICDASMHDLPAHPLGSRTARRGERLAARAGRAPADGDAGVASTASPTGARSRPACAPTSTSSTSTTLRLHAPEMVNDLPAGGRRLIQRVDGYRATVVAGEVTFEDGEATGARPGRLVRFT